MRSPAQVGNGVEVRVTGVEAVTSKGAGVGQIAGAPAVAVTLTLANRSRTAQPLTQVNVAAAYGPGQTPGVPVDGPPGRPFSGQLAPGSSATGVYLFAVPVEQRDQVSLTVNVNPSQPTVSFDGSLR